MALTPGSEPAVPVLSAAALCECLSRGDPLTVLDVREPWEYAGGTIPCAVRIPAAEVPAAVAALPKDRPVAVVCRSGRRSLAVAAYLAGRGFRVWNVAGGLLAWPGPLEPVPDCPPPPDPGLAGGAVLDTSGQHCPWPIVRLNQAMAVLPAGDELTFIATDSGAAEDVPVWCRRTGHELLAVETDGGRWRFRIRKARP